MRSKKQRTAATTAGPKNTLRTKVYEKSSPKSSSILKDEVGLLLWRLQVPLRREQRRAGYRLLEAMLAARYVGGAM